MGLRLFSALMAIASAAILGSTAYGSAVRTDTVSNMSSDTAAEPLYDAASDYGITEQSGIGSGARVPSAFSYEQINYFLEVALGSEYGSSSSFVRRWEDDIRIRINIPESEGVDSQTQQEVQETVADVVSDLNRLIAETHGISYPNVGTTQQRPIRIEIAESADAEANLDFYFVKAENFPIYDSNTRQGQVGFVWTWWNQDRINQSRILVASNHLSKAERDHVIREEITQALGILKDSWNYPSSIFYQGWTAPTEYDPIDEAVIKMLYSPNIRPGMSAAEVEAILNDL